MQIIPSRFFGLLFSFYFLLPASGRAQNIDINILKPINAGETHFKNDFTRIVTGSVAPVVIATPATLFATGWIRKDKKLQHDALYTAGGLAVNFVLTSSIKYIVDRPRPFETWSFIVKRTEESSGKSLPSLHTSFAFCIATSLSLRFPKWYVIIPSYFWAASTAYGRMYQGVHYPSDVLLGAMIGSATAWAAWKLQKKMTAKAQGPKASVYARAKLYF